MVTPSPSSSLRGRLLHGLPVHFGYAGDLCCRSRCSSLPSPPRLSGSLQLYTAAARFTRTSHLASARPVYTLDASLPPRSASALLASLALILTHPGLACTAVSLASFAHLTLTRTLLALFPRRMLSPSFVTGFEGMQWSGFLWGFVRNRRWNAALIGGSLACSIALVATPFGPFVCPGSPFALPAVMATAFVLNRAWRSSFLFGPDFRPAMFGGPPHEGAGVVYLVFKLCMVRSDYVYN
jgi:hypothetical protein